mmetsp:Transcript_20190/g.60212  ORF Transcript_20190/g.60212 Transcript_20190/m.60212 type:complete len:272 (-) Transcript_20190:64-879(-)
MRVFLALAACFGLAAGIAFPEHDCDEISDCAATLGQLCYEQVFGGGGPAKVDEDVAAGVAACLQGVGSPSAFDEEGVFQDAIYDEANVLVGGAQACVAGDEAALKHKKLKDAQAYLDCLDSKEAQDRAMYEVGEDGKKVKIPHGLACTQIFEEKCAVPERFADDPQKQKEADCCRLLAGLALGCPADNERYYFDLVTRKVVLTLKKGVAGVHEAFQDLDADPGVCSDATPVVTRFKNRFHDEKARICKEKKSHCFREMKKIVDGFEEARRM